MCDNKFPSLVASLFSCPGAVMMSSHINSNSNIKVASTFSFLHATMNLRPPSVTVSTHTSAFNAVDFQPPAMPSVWLSLCTQSVHSLLPTPSSPHCCTLKVSKHDSLRQPQIYKLCYINSGKYFPGIKKEDDQANIFVIQKRPVINTGYRDKKSWYTNNKTRNTMSLDIQ